MVNLFLLSYIGACPVEAPYEFLGQVLRVVYLSFFIVDPLVKKYVHMRLLSL